MLDLPRQTLDKITKVLLHRQKQVEEQLKSIDKNDPVLAPGVDEASESGTDSWKADVHSRLVAIKDDLGGLSKRITHALLRIKKGTYNKCENCGKEIEPERLGAMPTATLCVSCSRKTPKKR